MSLRVKSLQGNQIVQLGLLVNILLAGVKTAVGILGHSPALLAEGINSTSDIAYYLVVTVFMHISRRPPDGQHPHGHGQLESIAALVVGSFVITTAVAIFWNAVNAIFEISIGESDFAGGSVAALWVAVCTVGVKILLTFITRRVGRKVDSAMIQALAYDHRNDALSAFAAFIGIFLGRMGYLWVDPLAGAVVAILILLTGIGILRDASITLMEAVPDEKLVRDITKALRNVQGVLEVEEIHSRRLGPYLALDLTICVNGNISVKRGDEIASEAERVLYEQIELLRYVHIHYHPAANNAPV